jgi:CDP-glucose 4,6-dehydratase
MSGATYDPLTAELRRTYAGRRVLLTGHTGFKGSWLALWLAELGADVVGFALAPEDGPNLYEAADVAAGLDGRTADLRDLPALRAVIRGFEPEIVLHLAAQALVQRSYRDPIETLESNVLGTAHLLEAIRLERHRCAVVAVTSDKCYENREVEEPYGEDAPMGGADPYSMSKGAAELVVSSYRRSYFRRDELHTHGVAIATARAGNVIGGGDWSPSRLVPNALADLSEGQPIRLRNPDGVRPWQHVIEPLAGYLLLGARLSQGPAHARAAYGEGWNFGPWPAERWEVRRVVERIIHEVGSGRWLDVGDPSSRASEAGVLRLAIRKAVERLGWQPRWDVPEAITHTVAWDRAWRAGATPAQLRALCVAQIQGWCDAVPIAGARVIELPRRVDEGRAGANDASGAGRRAQASAEDAP